MRFFIVLLLLTLPSGAQTKAPKNWKAPGVWAKEERQAAISGLLSLIAVPPCRIVDTRVGTAPFGQPTMNAGETRTIPVPSSTCGIPATAQAYSLNFTVVPSGPLSYLSAWPTGQPQPLVSTLNSFEGAIVANAAVVPAGTNGSIDIFVTNTTDVIVDINGYFAQ